MLAACFDRHGGTDALEVREIARPEAHGSQLLVRVRAAALNPKDIVLRRGKFAWLTGRRFPMGVGFDWAGEALNAAGGFVPGDRLYGMLDGWRGATCAEFLVANPAKSARMPAGMSFTDGAALPLVGQTALQALRDLAHLETGQHVLIHGASGGLGTHAIQLAVALGARVTTTSSPGNFALCRSLGAGETLDRADAPWTEPRGYDAVFDVFGNLSLGAVRPALSARGRYVGTIPSPRIVYDVARTRFARQRAKLVIVRSRRADLDELTRLVDAGQLHPVIDRVLPLAEIRAAQAHIETKRARGKVVLEIP